MYVLLSAHIGMHFTACLYCVQQTRNFTVQLSLLSSHVTVPLQSDSPCRWYRGILSKQLTMLDTTVQDQQ